VSLSAEHEHHGHGRPRRRGNERALTIALGFNAAFLVIEAAVGWWTGSLALLSDAAHMLSDVTALGIALLAARLATMDAAPSRTFGLRRAEPVGAFVNALALLAACAAIMAEATHRLLSGAPDINPMPVLLVGIGGLAVNLGSAAVLARADRHNLNIRAALMHMMADALGSVGAIIAALAMMQGARWADAAVSVFIALLVLWAAVGLLRDSGRVLLEMSPRGIDVAAVEAALAEVDDVVHVHDLHVWTLDGEYVLLTCHIVVAADHPTEPVRRAAEALLRARFRIEHTTLQLERDRGPAAPGASAASERAH